MVVLLFCILPIILLLFFSLPAVANMLHLMEEANRRKHRQFCLQGGGVKYIFRGSIFELAGRRFSLRVIAEKSITNWDNEKRQRQSPPIRICLLLNRNPVLSWRRNHEPIDRMKNMMTSCVCKEGICDTGKGMVAIKPRRQCHVTKEMESKCLCISNHREIRFNQSENCKTLVSFLISFFVTFRENLPCFLIVCFDWFILIIAIEKWIVVWWTLDPNLSVTIFLYQYDWSREAVRFGEVFISIYSLRNYGFEMRLRKCVKGETLWSGFNEE